MTDKYVLLESKPSRVAGMFPYHVETLAQYQEKGAMENEWRIVFRGTDEECTAEMIARLDREPPLPPLLTNTVKRMVGTPATKEQRRAERGALTPSLRYSVIERDGFRCRKCGYAAADGAVLHVDHVTPVAMGGRTVYENLETLCDTCNLGKGAQMPEAQD